MSETRVDERRRVQKIIFQLSCECELENILFHRSPSQESARDENM